MTVTRITSTHHVAVAFDCPVETLWRDILSIADGARFARQGFVIEPIVDDPRAYLSGYRMWRKSADGVDERLCFVTELDEVAQRASVCAYYLGASSGATVVQSTYSAAASAQGSVYRIDCHATRDVEVEEGADPAEVAAMMSRFRQDNDHYMAAALEAERGRFEGKAR